MLRRNAGEPTKEKQESKEEELNEKSRKMSEEQSMCKPRRKEKPGRHLGMEKKAWTGPRRSARADARSRW